MSDIRDWSRDANNNQAPVPDGFPENMAPSGVNNSSREVMAADRRQWEVAQWFDWGHAITYVSTTSFTVPGDVTSVYHAGRRVWANMPVGGSIYGRVVNSTFVTSTTVEVVWDSGSLLLESGILMSVGILSTVNTAIPVEWLKTGLGLQSLAYKDEQTYTDELVPIGSMRVWPSATPPTTPGTWLICDGATVSQTTYTALFALIGHSFGADPGGGDFILPDLRGRTAFGYDAGGAAGRLTGYRQGIDASAVGNSGGEEAHTQTEGELAQHDHPYTRTNVAGQAVSFEGPTITILNTQETSDTSDVGSSEPMNITPPGQVFNWIIRAL